MARKSRIRLLSVDDHPLIRELDEETLDLRDEVLSTSMFEEIVGSSDAISRVTAKVTRVAPIPAGSFTILFLLAESIAS